MPQLTELEYDLVGLTCNPDKVAKLILSHLEMGTITLDWIIKQFPVNDVLDSMKINDILEYASENNPYDR